MKYLITLLLVSFVVLLAVSGFKLFSVSANIREAYQKGNLIITVDFSKQLTGNKKHNHLEWGQNGR